VGWKTQRGTTKSDSGGKQKQEQKPSSRKKKLAPRKIRSGYVGPSESRAGRGNQRLTQLVFPPPENKR
jgi:hypothetical protein